MHGKRVSVDFEVPSNKRGKTITKTYSGTLEFVVRWDSDEEDEDGTVEPFTNLESDDEVTLL